MKIHQVKHTNPRKYLFNGVREKNGDWNPHLMLLQSALKALYCICIFGLLVCLSVCLYSINVKKSVRAGLSIASMNYNNKIIILIKWKLNINYLDFSDSLVSPGSPFLSSTDPSSVYTQLSFSLQNSFSQYHGWWTPPWSVSSQCWCSSSTSSPAPPATTTGSGTGANVEETKFKGTVSVISSDSKCEDGNARFTTVPW